MVECEVCDIDDEGRSATNSDIIVSFATESEIVFAVPTLNSEGIEVSSESEIKVSFASSSIIITTCSFLFEEKVKGYDTSLFGADAGSGTLMCDSLDFNKIFDKIQASYSSIKNVVFIEYQFLEASDSNVEIQDFVEGKTLYTKWDEVGDTLRIRTGGYTVNALGDVTNIYNNFLIKNYVGLFKNWKNIYKIDSNVVFMYESIESGTNYDEMFKGCDKLENIDFNNWNTRNIENFSGLFASCSELRNLNLNFFDTRNAKDMSYMFSDCLNIETLNIMSFNTKKVLNMSYMFNNIDKIKIINIYNFNTKNVENMSYMFANCDALKTIYVAYDFNTDKLTNVSQHRDIFINSRELVGGYHNTIYDENIIDKTYARIDGDIRLFGRPPGYLTFYYPSTKVRLKANGGRFLNGSEEKIYDIEPGDSTAWFEEPSRQGYAFENYYVGNDLLTDTWNYAILSDMHNLIIDVDARWTANNYRVTYNSNGGRGSMPVDIATYRMVYGKRQFIY